MAILKKAIRTLAILIASLVLLFLVLFIPTWPSKARLCHDVEKYLPKEECVRLDNAIGIIKGAFPIGKVSSGDVKSALGKYLHTEYPASYGHVEVYYLSISPIDYLFRSFDTYHFRYDRNEVLIAFDHYD